MPGTASRQSPTAARSGRRRAPRGGLTRERVARAALEILDAEGVDGLTMRRVAERLGVGTMSLYGHVRGKEDLLDAAIDAASAPADLRLEGTWREQLTTLATTARAMLERHPAIVAVRMRDPVLRPEALRFAEAGLTVLRGAGLDASEAARAFRLLFTYTFGYCGLSPSARAEQARRQADVAVAGLPPQRFPQLHDARAEVVDAMAGDETFAFGLECILDGIEARAARGA